jgi:hypothetical protein
MREETTKKIGAEISKFCKLTKTGKTASPNWGGARPNSGGKHSSESAQTLFYSPHAIPPPGALRA